MRKELKRAWGIGWFVLFALLIWSAAPLIAIAGNAVFRPGYHVRDLGSEYRARLMPNRVRWHELKVYRMDCALEGERRVVILHTTEFAETPVEFLTRRFPGCSDFTQQKDRVPGIFSGLLLDRW